MLQNQFKVTALGHPMLSHQREQLLGLFQASGRERTESFTEHAVTHSLQFFLHRRATVD